MEVAESGTGGQVAPVGGSIIVGDQRIRERRKDDRHAVDERRLDGRRGKNKEGQWAGGRLVFGLCA